jgi:hypothetical protein
MLVFILLSLALAFIVQTSNPLEKLLSEPFLLYVGIGGALAAIGGSLFKKGNFRIWYDLFASSILVTWFSYWKTQFNEDSPMFFFFPVYFAAMSAFISLAFINQCERLDDETLRYMRLLTQQNGLQPWVIMLGALGSLQLLNHYQVFPVMVTLLLLRFALDSCVEQNRRRNI